MTNQFIVRMSLAVALMGAATGAFAQAKADKAAQTFMTKAIEGNLAEVSMGQLAQKQGESDAVRSFGQKLVADHSAANQKAASIASQIGVTPPTEPSKKHQSNAAKMAKMSGAEFDRAFARHMVTDHKMEIAAHKRAAKMKNDAVASYATESLPVLEQHLQTAESLSKAGGKAGGKAGKPSM